MSLHATPWIDRPRLGTAPSALSNCTRLFQENQLKLLTELAEQHDGLGRSGKLLVPLAVSDTQLSRRQHCGSRDANFKSPIACYGWGRASGPFTNTGPAVRRTSHYTPAIAHFATSPRVSLPRTLQAKMQALGNWPFYATPCNGVRSGAPVHASAQESLQKFSKHEGFPSDKVLDSRCMLDQRRCAASYPEAKFDTCHRRISSNKNTKSGKAQLSVGTTPTTRTQHNLSLRRKFRRSVRLAILMHRIQVPARKGHQALLEVKHHLVRDAVRATLWEWPTVLAFFQQPSSDLQAITWPTATSVRIHPSCERNLEVPAGCIEGCALPSLLRAVGLNNNMIVCLLEARFGKWLPILCVLQKNGHPQGDWSLRESYPDCALSMLFYEDFRSALAPSANELDDIREHYHNEIEKQAKSQERLKNREIARERKLKKVRQWVIDDLDEAFREWPPRVRKKQPAFKIRERQRALEYAMEAGRLGRKGGLSTIAVSFTGCGHVRLRSPGVRQCLYNCAREGMGFGGLSAKEIVETCYVYCAERLQAAWRGQILARKFARARALWVKCDHDLLRRVLVPWAQDSLRVACLRRACLRKLIAWCRWTKRRIYRKQVFRTCFWPFYTWRKEATASSKAREKARFLSLVWLHYTKLRNIRAWRMLTAKRTSDKRRADRYCRARTHEELAKKLSVWHIYASSRRRVRGIWLRRPNGGATLLRRILLTHLGKALVVWKYWIFLSKLCRNRAASWFRRIRADEEMLNSMSRDVRTAKGKKKRGLENAIKSIEVQRAKLLELPPPEQAPCFQCADTNLEDAAPVPKEGGTTSDIGEQRLVKTTLNSDQLSVCSPLKEYFYSVVMPREVCACWMMYWRAGPHILRVLRLFALERRKKNIADLFFGERCLRSHFSAWYTFTSQRRADCENVEMKTGDESAGEDVSQVSTRERSRGVGTKWSQGQVSKNDTGLHRLVEDFKPVGRSKGLGKSQTTQSENNLRLPGIPGDLSDFIQTQGERDVQAEKCDVLLAEARELTAQVRATAIKDRQDRETMESKHVEQMDHIDLFLAEKERRLDETKKELRAYVENFYEHAAQKLVDSVYRGLRDAAQMYDRRMMRHAFRSIRTPWAERRSAVLLRRQILRNRLKICARLRRLERSMPVYRVLRMKLRSWSIWSQLPDNHTAWRSPGVKATLLHRRELALLASKELALSGAVRGMPLRDMGQLTNLRGCYVRWLNFIQNSVRWRALSDVLARQRELRLMFAVFAALRYETGIPTSSKLFPGQDCKEVSLLRRCKADIGCYRTLFLAARRRKDLLYSVQRAHSMLARKVRDAARKGPSFKKFICVVRDEMAARMQFERQLLLEAFKLRGHVVSEDMMVEAVKPERPNLCDALTFRDAPVPTGCRLGAVLVVTKRERGLLGIGSVVAGDCETMANPIHGGSDGVHHSFEWGLMERLTALELAIGPNVIEAIRFEVSVFGNASSCACINKAFGGWAKTTTRTSRWYGRAISFEARRIRLSGPPNTEVIGFIGLATTSRIVTLGLHLRTVKEESIFSYRWTAPLNQPLLLRQDFPQSDEERMSNVHLPCVTDSDSPRKKEIPDECETESESDTELLKQVSSVGCIDEEGSTVVQEATSNSPLLTVQEEQCVAEFVAILRFRQIDCLSAASRAEAFARRAWSSRAVRAQIELKPLRRLPVIMGLARWLLSALAAPLPPLPENETEANRKLARARALEKAASIDRSRADRLEARVLQRRALHEQKMNAPENSELRCLRAFHAPQWRKAEKARVDKDDHDHAVAASKRALANLAISEAKEMAMHAEASKLRLDPRAPRIRKCYGNLMTTARHQYERNEEFQVEVRENRGALKANLYESIIESILARREQAKTHKKLSSAEPSEVTASNRTDSSEDDGTEEYDYGADDTRSIPGACHVAE